MCSRKGIRSRGSGVEKPWRYRMGGSRRRRHSQALWNLSGAYQKGFEIDLHQIPVRQETIEVCEFYDLSPYDLLCGNCMVFVADNGAHLVKELENWIFPPEPLVWCKRELREKSVMVRCVASWTGLKRMRYMRSLMRRQFYERKNFSDYGKEQQN